MSEPGQPGFSNIDPDFPQRRRPRIPSPSFAQPFHGSERARSSLLRLKPERVCYLNCEESCNVTEADTLQASGLLRVRKSVFT